MCSYSRYKYKTCGCRIETTVYTCLNRSMGKRCASVERPAWSTLDTFCARHTCPDCYRYTIYQDRSCKKCIEAGRPTKFR